MDLGQLGQKLRDISVHGVFNCSLIRGLRATTWTVLVQLTLLSVSLLPSQVVERVDKLQERWQDAKTVRLRDKVCFVIGIMNLVISSLVFAFSPQYVPLLYGIQSLYFLPLRIYSYRKLQWHYFLYDYCYFAAILNLVYLYVFPKSQMLFLVVYCSAHGPLAFSVATWRNSYVPHSLEKMISLFIHIYPPFVFTTIVHFIPREISVVKYPALKDLDVMNPWNAFFLNVLCYGESSGPPLEISGLPSHSPILEPSSPHDSLFLSSLVTVLQLHGSSSITNSSLFQRNRRLNRVRESIHIPQ